MSEDDDDDVVKRLRALLARVDEIHCELPWRAYRPRGVQAHTVVEPHEWVIASTAYEPVSALIAEGITALPGLLDRVEAAESERDSLRARISDIEERWLKLQSRTETRVRELEEQLAGTTSKSRARGGE